MRLNIHRHIFTYSTVPMISKFSFYMQQCSSEDTHALSLPFALCLSLFLFYAHIMYSNKGLYKNYWGGLKLDPT